MSVVTETVYHGTTKKNALSILKSNEFIPGEDNIDEQYLGKGIYFFRNMQHAVWWNLRHASHNNVTHLIYRKYMSKYSVLNCKIEYDEENLLDLNDMNQVAKYNKICQKLKDKFLNDDDYKNAKYKDRAIINFLYKNNYMEGISIIRKIVGQKVDVDELNVATHIQRDMLCIKDGEIIKEIEDSTKIEENEYNNIKAVSLY